MAPKGFAVVGLPCRKLPGHQSVDKTRDRDGGGRERSHWCHSHCWGCDGTPVPGPAMAVALFGVLTPIAIFFAYFGAFVPPTDAGRYVMGAWLPLFSRTIFANIFYLQGMGLDAPWENLARMAYLALCAAVFVGIAVAIDARMRGAAANPLRLNLALSLALMMVFIALRITWRDSGRAIPALSFATLGMLALHLHRGRHDHAVHVRLIPLIMWNVLGLAFLAKILLYTRFYHYGFALAMPAIWPCFFKQLPGF